MSMASHTTIRRKSSLGGEECDECKARARPATGMLRRKASAANGGSVLPPAVHEVLGSTGAPLEPAVRAAMEPRFGGVAHAMPRAASRPAAGLTVGSSTDPAESAADALAGRAMREPASATGASLDFSRLRVHTGAQAASAAQALSARAFTVGNQIVFGAGQYRPHTSDGAMLLAHELAHVVHEGGLQASTIRRAGMADVRLAEASEALELELRGMAQYKALDAADKTLADDIITRLATKPPADRHRYLIKLKALLALTEKAADKKIEEQRTEGAVAVKSEKVRLATKTGKVNQRKEETATAAAKKKGPMIAIPGKFGGGTYYVERSSANRIVVYASVYLKQGAGAKKSDVTAVKALEDAIEKAASTTGYSVDLEFVNAKKPDAFEVNVHTGEWRDATNWSPGDAWGLAHELHHLLAFELDRYNYIESHAENTAMKLHDRLYWFQQELTKPADYNDETSLMNHAEHPNDRDVCQTAGFSGADLTSCITTRKGAAAAP